jgi:hypothetical protein
LFFDSELLCHRKFTFLQFFIVSAIQEVFFFMNYPREESDPLFQAAWSENVGTTLENPSIPAKKPIDFYGDFGFGMKSHHHLQTLAVFFLGGEFIDQIIGALVS